MLNIRYMDKINFNNLNKAYRNAPIGAGLMVSGTRKSSKLLFRRGKFIM